MYHQIVIVGNLGRDPEMRYTPSGTPVTSFNVATNRKYTGSDGQQVKETTWFRVSVFGKQAEACATYLKKGSAALVEGRLNPDPQSGGPKTFQRQDGSTGASFEVHANTVRFLSGRGEGGAPMAESADDSAGSVEDIPF
ncbi:MAG: single-stranded DNA-binding protein [Anaerolineae bacterium]